MKVCIITPSFVGGGAERVAVNLANQYASSGHEVAIIVFNGVGPYRAQVGESVKIIDLGVSRMRFVWFSLFSSLRGESPNVVLSVMRSANIFTGFVGYCLPRLKIVFREANTLDGVAQASFFKRAVFLFLLRVSYRRAKTIIANSVGTKSDLVRHGIAQSSKVVVIGNPVVPVDVERLADVTPDHPWLSDSSIRVVLSVGRLHKQKNQQLLIKAFAKSHRSRPDIRLIIMGEGEERESLLKLRNRLGLEEAVDIAKFRSNPYPVYKSSSLFVLTSDWEGFGNVIVEAMASGVPVVSTDCPGGPDSILEHGRYGHLVPVGDVCALVEAMDRVLDGRSTIDLNLSRARAFEFGVESVSRRYMQVFLSV